MPPTTDDRVAELERANAELSRELAACAAELNEARGRERAVSAILEAISRSPADARPVFDAIVENATRLCQAEFTAVARFDGELLHLVAINNLSPEETTAFHSLFPRPPTRNFAMGRTFLEDRPVQFADVLAEPDYDPGTLTTLQSVIRYRSFLGVPIRREGRPIGVIGCGRRAVQPVSDAEIAILETFADQAAIALENARLLAETREALEQQTATAEVLQVINGSPGELQPVFEAILEKGHELCGVARGSLQLYDGEKFSAVAVHGLSGALADRLREGYRPGPTYPVWRILEGERFIHTPDLAEIDDPLARRIVALGGARTLLWVALRRDDKLFGLIAAARLEVRPFSEKEIALLESFAAQAVIAMDNARLLNEIRQRQAELRVTFDNMGDGVAMFDAGLRLAAWNRNFVEILDLPERLLDARPGYADFLRLLAERGEFGIDDIEGELARRLAQTDRELRLERTRPDGRVVEVRRNTVPGGGFVLIYSDITERKRAEAEIRAARDAAERALRELQAAQASLVHAQKMAALGQLTAGIAHEIKNPLNFVNNFADLSVELLGELKDAATPVVSTLGDDERAELEETIDTLSGNLGKIAEHGRRADGIVKSMLQHSRGDGGDWQTVDLNALVDEALNLAYHGARAQYENFNITLERDFDHSLAPIEIVPQDVVRVFLNLFGNSFYAALKKSHEIDGGFRPLLRVATRDLGETVEIRVRDNGTGIAPEHRERLFQPFFTTKPTGEGTGLGLSISYDVVTQRHGGTIAVDSKAGEFTEFTVQLPRRRRAAAGRAT
ncbi:MAG TPA: PAS-domain containing protein [Stellaceae bacterium]